MGNKTKPRIVIINTDDDYDADDNDTDDDHDTDHVEQQQDRRGAIRHHTMDPIHSLAHDEEYTTRP